MTYELYQGDCLAVMPGLGAVDAIISDAPYGIAHRRGKARNRGKGITLGTLGIIGDDAPFDPAPWLGFPIVVLFGANWFADKLPPGRWLIWDKQEHGGSGDFSEAEIAWCNRGRALKIFRHMWLGVQRASEVGMPQLHPMQKPVKLMEWIMDTAGVPRGATVLDPYMGSGTTGVACARTGRHFIGIERDAEHFSTAQRRIADAYAAPVQLSIEAAYATPVQLELAS